MTEGGFLAMTITLTMPSPLKGEEVPTMF